MRKHRVAAVAALAVWAALCGCFGTIDYKYTYDPAANFSGQKTYEWVTQPSYSTPHAPLQDYVLFTADRALEAKGWKKVSDQPELLFAVDLDFDTYDGYQLRGVTLRASRRDTGVSVWRGSALGKIDGSATSPDLQDAVNKILSTFPPK